MIRIVTVGLVGFFLFVALTTAPTSLAQRQISPAPRSDRAPAEPVQNAEPGLSRELDSQEVPAKPGEICAVCDEPVGTTDATYLINGQRVPVHRGACDAKFRANPQLVLARLQPRGAFLGASQQERALSRAWSLVGFYILIALLFAALCAQRALHTGHNPAAWFAAGLIFSVFAYAVLLTRPKRAISAPAGVPAGMHKVAATYAPESCPVCGSSNHPSATACLNCGATLTPRIPSEASRALPRAS